MYVSTRCDHHGAKVAPSLFAELWLEITVLTARHMSLEIKDGHL